MTKWMGKGNTKWMDHVISWMWRCKNPSSYLATPDPVASSWNYILCSELFEICTQVMNCFIGGLVADVFLPPSCGDGDPIMKCLISLETLVRFCLMDCVSFHILLSQIRITIRKLPPLIETYRIVLTPNRTMSEQQKDDTRDALISTMRYCPHKIYDGLIWYVGSYRSETRPMKGRYDAQPSCKDVNFFQSWTPTYRRDLEVSLTLLSALPTSRNSRCTINVKRNRKLTVTGYSV